MDRRPESEITIADTLITLTVCFVIAMAYRGFVLEGFVIPTGSMAPTLLGDHALWRSPATGYSFATDTGEKFVSQRPRGRGFDIADPMLDRNRAFTSADPAQVGAASRAGDRVLVFKWFYSFFNPDRFDVIVFKNPTKSWENYIKRVVGLPGEEIWLADGDVFARPVGDESARFAIERKPFHVQRAVWQPVFDSAYVPGPMPDNDATFRPADSWLGAARNPDNPRAYRIDSPKESSMRWDNAVRPLDDWNAYNMLGANLDPPLPVSDVRVLAALTPDSAGLRASLRLTTRGHHVDFIIDGQRATLRVAPINQPDRVVLEQSEEIETLRPGRTTVVEFWHVDQSMRMLIDDETIVSAQYDWDAWQRLDHATGQDVRALIETSRALNPLATQAPPTPPALELSFSGSPVTIQRLQVDRDIYYRPVDGLDSVATHPHRTARLYDDQFFMLGDNSGASADGRVWGEPDELVAAQIDPAPFIVNRKLIIGKAWSVYFPSPYPLVEGGRRFIPDFGRVRFIR